MSGVRPCQITTMAAAMNTLEYVPVMIPTIIVNAKPLSTSPPKKNSAITDSSVSPPVIIVRSSIWLTAALTMLPRLSRRIERMFSRTRS